ncbi:hypothetical protein Ahy_B05g078474 [Arachis hypogaea]|uniref:Uncharacterized protein n=1 Tax=Arachis hypogaea TaxID=3818 RepID=A0A444Z786_ARAHY|nr:hypothetical protein Ahy_B05g078474 [Arachis hypogaea]
MTDELSNVNGGSSTNDSIPVTVQSVDVISRSEGVIGSESIAVTTKQTESVGCNIRPRGTLPPTQPPLTTGWPPYGLPPGSVPPVGSFVPPVRFGTVNGGNNFQNPQQHSEYSRYYNLGSTSNAANSMAVYRQQVEESHHDLVNLLTQQMTTILNPMMADHESKFERLARQVERIARIVDYKEGERHDVRGNNEGFENVFQNENNVLNIENSHIVPCGQDADERRNSISKQRSIWPNLKRALHMFARYLKKLPSNEKSNESKLKGGKKDLIQEAIMEGHLKFDDEKREMKVDVDPFDTDASFVEPYFRVNMVGMSYDFDVALDDFESQVRSVYPREGDDLLDFLVQQKIKDRDVSLCLRCNAIFDAEAIAIFRKKE